LKKIINKPRFTGLEGDSLESEANSCCLPNMLGQQQQLTTRMQLQQSMDILVSVIFDLPD
jgi:hypothetical protein